MKEIAFYSLALVLFSCEVKTDETQTEVRAEQMKEEVKKPDSEADFTSEIEPDGQIFRCDGAHPGISSEWIQVGFPFDGMSDKLDGIWYWDTKNETKQALKIVSQSFKEDGDNAGYVGKLKFKGNPTVYEFSVGGENFVLTDPETETKQVFTFDYDEN